MTLAVVFPGQGSQSVGMLGDYAAEPLVRRTIAECSDATGLHLAKLIESGPEEELGRTANTQPALLAAEIALYRLWQDRAEQAPALAAGHSLGEYAALVAAEALPLASAAALLHRRGQLMQAAVPEGEGAMAAVLGLEEDPVQDCCSRAEQQSGKVVQAANFNSPGQIVISGHTRAVALASDLCQQAGARRTMPLPVSVPSHCRLMREAAAQLEQAIRTVDWSAPAFPVIQNTCADSFDDPAQITRHLIQQLFSPVRWTQCVQALIGMGAGRLVECGPGKVLTGLNRRISREVEAVAIGDLLPTLN